MRAYVSGSTRGSSRKRLFLNASHVATSHFTACKIRIGRCASTILSAREATFSLYDGQGPSVGGGGGGGGKLRVRSATSSETVFAALATVGGPNDGGLSTDVRSTCEAS